MIWIISVLSAPLSLVIASSYSIFFLLTIAILLLNFAATFKLLNLNKNEQAAHSVIEKIGFFLWFVLVGLTLMVSVFYGGCLMFLSANDLKLR